MQLFSFFGKKERIFRFFRIAIDLNHYLSNSELRPVDNITSLRPRSIIYGVCRFFLGFLYELAWLPYSIFSCFIFGISKAEIVFIVNSKNQLEVATAVLQETSKKNIKIVWINGKPLGRLGHRYPAALAYAFALFDFIKMLALIAGAKDYLARAVRSRLDYYWIANAHVRIAKFWLKALKVDKVIFSNDHIVWSRAIALAARNMGLETIYVEHAAVSKFFPPLIWSKALLGGKKSIEAYGRMGTNTKIVCTGMPRFDRLFPDKTSAGKERTQKITNAIGIAVNQLDDLAIIKRIITSFIGVNKNIVIRTHPRDKRILQFSEMEKQYVSFDRSANIVDYFKKIEALIGGDSTILLEAALFGIPVAYCKQLGTGNDYYGFVKAGICFEFSMDRRVQDEHDRLKKFVPNSVGMKDYYAPYGTSNAGNAAKLICREILNN